MGSLDRRDRARIIEAVERLADTGHGDVTRLRGYTPAQWQLRVGDWRVRFSFEQDADRVLVLRVLRRNERAYRQ